MGKYLKLKNGIVNWIEVRVWAGIQNSIATSVIWDFNIHWQWCVLISAFWCLFALCFFSFTCLSDHGRWFSFEGHVVESWEGSLFFNLIIGVLVYTGMTDLAFSIIAVMESVVLGVALLKTTIKKGRNEACELGLIM